MWPKLLDLTRDECRGILRRLELESYSTVIGAFRAQGTLSTSKQKILEDLRKTFHISEDRHKAEIRRVVNDESLSTIAKIETETETNKINIDFRTYGPNSEIEWNKEGSRGFLIIDRKPSQTALSAVANSASELGEKLNQNLAAPTKSARERILTVQDEKISNGTTSEVIVADPNNFEIKKNQSTTNNAIQRIEADIKSEPNRSSANSSVTIKRENNKQNVDFEELNSKDHIQNGNMENKMFTPLKIGHDSATTTAKLTLANIRRRKSTTSIMNNINITPKPLLLPNKREIAIAPKSCIDNGIISNPLDIVNPNHVTQASNDTQQTNIKNDSMKVNVRDAYNAANASRVFELIEGNAVKTALSAVKRSSPILKKPRITASQPPPPPTPTPTPLPPVLLNTQRMKSQTFQPNIVKSNPLNKQSNLEYYTSDDCTRLTSPIKSQKAQMINVSTAPIMNTMVTIKKKVQLPSHKNDFISIPTARNPNIVKTNDRTIMHVTPINQTNRLTISNANNQGSMPKKINVQIISPRSQSRTVTIHPSSAMFQAAPHTTVNEIEREQSYDDQINDWHNYDLSNIVISDESTKSDRSSRGDATNDHPYQHSASKIIAENIIYSDNIEDDIITEEYITSEEFSPDNVIEMIVDSSGCNDVL